MNKNRIAKVLFFVITIFFIDTCSDDDYEFRLCPNKCSSSEPWRVESLDLNLPCFSTKEECLEWATTHGYSDKTCIKCD